MSRYTVTTTGGERTDVASVLGFDPPLRTFFLQAFADPETESPEQWLGTRLEEYPTLEDLVTPPGLRVAKSATSARMRSWPC